MCRLYMVRGTSVLSSIIGPGADAVVLSNCVHQNSLSTSGSSFERIAYRGINKNTATQINDHIYSLILSQKNSLILLILAMYAHIARILRVLRGVAVNT